MIRGILLLISLVWAFIVPGTAFADYFRPFDVVGIDPRPGAAVPLDGQFIDEAGRPVTLRKLAQGRPILLAPVLHDCPNICGLTLSGLMEAIEAQPFRPSKEFVVVAFGIDPHEGPREAQESLGQLRQRFSKLTGGVHALTGSETNIRAVTDALGYRYAWDADTKQYAHEAAVALLTPQGTLSRWLYGLAPDAGDLKLALTEAGQGRLGNWGDRLLLLCYHYDPAMGRYSPAIKTALSVGGGATVVAGAGWITVMLLRERKRGRAGERGR
ncbi:MULTISPECIES: SCO family protein [unclassified Sinorhizobium]|uniref:SCO family protein n=1 Tax=unclassified Sinorhizobium TaxID=2613772 RepID=UPI003524A424